MSVLHGLYLEMKVHEFAAQVYNRSISKPTSSILSYSPHFSHSGNSITDFLTNTIKFIFMSRSYFKFSFGNTTYHNCLLECEGRYLKYQLSHLAAHERRICKAKNENHNAEFTGKKLTEMDTKYNGRLVDKQKCFVCVRTLYAGDLSKTSIQFLKHWFKV